MTDSNAHLEKKTSGGPLYHNCDGCYQAHEEERQKPEALVRDLAIKQDEQGQG